MNDSTRRGAIALTDSDFNDAARKRGLTQYIIREPARLDPSEYLNLGILEPLRPSPESDFGKWVMEAVQAKRSIRPMDRADEWPLTFGDYKDAIGKIDQIRRGLFHERTNERLSYIPNDSPELRRFANELYDRERHSPDFTGYVLYLGAANWAFADAILRELGKVSANIPESIRKEHTYIVGGTGSGKSELMKLLIHHYVSHPDKGAVLIIDPHGPVSRQVARWREFSGSGSDRLVYLDATAKPDMGGFTPAMNPIQRTDLDEDDEAEFADMLADALAYLGGDGEGLTHHMKRLASHGMQALISLPDGTIEDLWAGLTEGKGSRLVKAGLAHPNPIIRGHYERLFFSDTFSAGRTSLSSRLEGALAKPSFHRMMTAPNPFNLPQALNAGKVVCVNCAALGSNAAVLGRFLMAQVAGMGKMRLRQQHQRHMPVHVFVDETTKLVSPPIFEILQEFRKVGIYLTMAQQSFGQGMDRDMRQSTKDNTALKFLGWTGNATEFFKMMDWDSKDMPKLEKQEFVVGVGNTQMKLKPHRHLADDTNAMSDREWERVLGEQFERYYRRPDVKSAPSPPPAAPDQTWAD